MAAIGVIFSLLFVGFQIQDGNRETRAATIQSALDSEMALQAEMLRYVDTWEKIANGVPLSDGAETRAGIILFNMLMTANENKHLQFESGYLENGPDLQGIAAFPFYDTWRDSAGADSRSPGFLELMDDLRTRHSGE